MSVKSFDKIQAEADQLIRVWTANPTFSLGNVSLATFESMVAAFKDTRSATDDLRAQLTKSISDTNDQADAVTEIIIRSRSGIRAYFGADSSQYELIGGTRTSQRRTRRPKAASQAATP
jgi:hypothetical protein